ncbi:hypothetical protein V8F33_000677 [Rhypophila sp. PSN 637]
MASNTLLRPCLRTTSSLSSPQTPLTILRPALNSRIPQSQSRSYKQYKVPDSEIPVPSVSGKTGVAGLEIPPYPFGERQFYKQSNRGLYGSARIRFGNVVSERNEIKTRRKWRPNVQNKRLWSESLGIMVRTRVTTRVLRTIDKLGGLDEYLLGSKTGRIKDLGPWGWMLRWRIMQTPKIKERFAREREALGLPLLKETQSDAQLEADMQSVVVGTGIPAHDVLAETDRMLKGDQEFAIGEEDTLSEEVKEDEFMKEVDPRKS